MTHTQFLEARAYAYSEYYAQTQTALPELAYDNSRLARSILEAATVQLIAALEDISKRAEIESALRGPEVATPLPRKYEVRALNDDDVEFITIHPETCAVTTGCHNGVFASNLLLYVLPNLKDVVVELEGEHQNSEGWVTIGGYDHPVDAARHYAERLADAYKTVEEVPEDCGYLTLAMREVITNRKNVQ